MLRRVLLILAALAGLAVLAVWLPNRAGLPGAKPTGPPPAASTTPPPPADPKPDVPFVGSPPPSAGSSFSPPAGVAPIGQAASLAAPTATPTLDPSVPTERTQPAILRPDGTRVLPQARELVQNLNAPSSPPAADLEILEDVFAEYRRVFGENPSGGLNAEIVAGLTGKNARRLAVFPPDFDAINSDGELLDRWGTPFFFHPVSRQLMQVVSAGPDGALWTMDDVGPAGGLQSGPL